ncbi:MAG: conjugal transfer protein TraX [Eggerthellaceae bacterium]|nr:conjugal transfer protein TraX [Eggerthellaceae bacterium]
MNKGKLQTADDRPTLLTPGGSEGGPFARAARQPQPTRPLWTSRGISSFWLKLAAIVAMTCDHVGLIFYPHLPLEARCVLIGVGGLTFPVMAFLLVEGYVHTSNLGRYALRLLAFALVSEVPFWLFLGHEGNVLFTLLASLGALWFVDRVDDALVRTVGLGGCLAASLLCDWGVVGPALVLLFFTFRANRFGVALPMALPIVMGVSSTWGSFAGALGEGSWRNLPFLLYYAAGCTAAIPLLSLYNGTRGTHPMKWFFYAYYPAHIAVLGLAYVVMFGSMPSLMVGW